VELIAVEEEKAVLRRQDRRLGSLAGKPTSSVFADSPAASDSVGFCTTLTDSRRR